VVDIDTREPVAGVDLPETGLVAHTPRGQHRWYLTTTPVRPATAVAEHVDIRGIGSYVVAPPSVTPTGTYAWASEGEATDAPAWVTEHRKQDGMEPEAGEPLTTRDHILHVAGVMRRQGLEAGDIYAVLAQMRKSGRITDADLARPWTAADLRKIANEAGKWARGELLPERMTVTIARATPVEDDDAATAFWADMETARILTINAADVDRSPPAPLVGKSPFLHPTRATLLFGTGGSGKGVIAAELMAERTRRGERVMVLDYDANSDEWASRIYKFGGDLDLVEIALPVTEDGGWLRGPIWQQAEDIRRLIDALNVRWVVVDSALAACEAAGDQALSDPNVPKMLYAALRRLGVPPLVLAHVSATGMKDPEKPYGSVYWVNYARAAWSIADDGNDGRSLVFRKRNRYRNPGPYRIDWAWAETLADGETPAALTWVQARPLALVNRAAAAIQREGPLTISALVLAVNDDGGAPTKRTSLVPELSKHPGFTPTDGKWTYQHPVTVQTPQQRRSKRGGEV
jgi:hypothetical protein